MQLRSVAAWLVAMGFACGDSALRPDAAAPDASVDDAGVPVDGDAAAPDPAAPVLAGTWGRYGLAPGEFVEPSSVELDTQGFVYVAGHENRVQKFTRDGEMVLIWGTAGVGDGEFNHPHGLAIDRLRGDLVYVGDQENRRVQVFTPQGTFVRRWTDAEFKHIHDVGIDPATGDIFVGDYERDLLQKFTANGAPLAELGGTGPAPGQFRGIWGVSTDSGGNVYVADTFNKRVQKLDRAGTFVRQWGAADSRFMKPTGVFVDARDIVYVCDSLADAVLLFDVDGNFIRRWDLAAIVGSASEPEDIVLDAAGKHIYIADVLSHRVIHLTAR